jgi:MED6 mediator sub complex component
VAVHDARNALSNATVAATHSFPSLRKDTQPPSSTACELPPAWRTSQQSHAPRASSGTRLQPHFEHSCCEQTTLTSLQRGRLSCNPLNRWSVLEYLAITHFYEPAGCVNEKAVAEGKHLSDTGCVNKQCPLLSSRDCNCPPPSSCTCADSCHACSRHLSCGPDEHEYAVTEALDPALYVIHKRRRAAGGAVRRLAVFYVLDGSVYQAPTLHAVVSSRVARCGHHLREALELLREARTSAVTGGDASSTARADPAGMQARQREDVRFQQMVFHALRTADEQLAKQPSAPATLAAAETGATPMALDDATH